jgi:hypothetical protein
MNFEAGALSKTVENAYVCPFLIDLQRSDVKPPLSKFQSTQPVERDVLKLVSTLNRAVKASGDKGRRDEPSLEEAFRHWWPHLQASLEHLPDDDDAPNRRRSDREILEEVLGLLRKQDRNNLPVTGYEFELKEDSPPFVPRSSPPSGSLWQDGRRHFKLVPRRREVDALEALGLGSETPKK